MVRTRTAPTRPSGASKTLKTTMLETGARLMQDLTPVRRFDIYVIGFHCAKTDPMMQMEAHHYCSQMNEDFLQCLIFDGNTRDANLLGIEYIVSERIFDTLDDREKEYWHPHNYEIFSAQLIAPGLPEAAEKALMKTLVNSYGKTWHAWHTGLHHKDRPGDKLPLGDPMLMWSFNRDGEADIEMERDRDDLMEVDREGKKRDRAGFEHLARPQSGEDVLEGRFRAAHGGSSPGAGQQGNP